MQKVIFKKILNPSLNELFNNIQYIIGETGINKNIIGSRCLIKINAMSREVLPGRNTSPWVLEAILKCLKQNFPAVEFVIGDSDVAGFPQFRQACKNWGYDGIAGRYGVKIINLANDNFVKRNIDSPFCPVMELPETVMKVDSIINVPVIKTHVLTGITCCLKNHWGLLPRFRYRYHVHVSEVIAEINKQIDRTVLNIVDGTVCIEGSGPKTGKPKICSVLFGGTDRVAVDSAALEFMGFSGDMAVHVGLSEGRGVGSTKFVPAGDPFEVQNFEKPDLNTDVVSYLERKLRGIPLLGKMLYHPAIALVLGLIGTKYNELVWFRIHGQKYIKEIICNTAYETEFKDLLTKSGRQGRTCCVK